MKDNILRVTDSRKKSELLAPAGSFAALEAAIDGGADAVYMGGASFNARINAKNFTPEELTEGIKRAHFFGTKVYIALNTLVYDRELDGALFAASDAYLRGADALIVADTGLASEIRKRIPIELHASTQLSGHNTDAARLLAENGFSRMVLAREMSREDIARFTAESPIEAEVFVHGALCVCHSGQCLFSSLVGGRSGNRGECAQPCRLPFEDGRGKQSYPLSLKDLSLARHIPELMDMGVASFKIEGRMKSPEYVRDTVRIWRRLMDERRGADDRDMAELSSIFSRGGFTDGYYTSRIGRSMLGVRSDEDKKSTRELEAFSAITRKIPVNMKATLRAGEPITLELWDESRRVRAEGDIVQKALNAPLSEEGIKKNLSKLGGTDLALSSIVIDADEGIMLPVSSLNKVRREAVELFTAESAEKVRGADDISESGYSLPRGKRENKKTAVFYFPENIPPSAFEYFDIIYTPLERYDGSTNGVMLPPVIFDSEREKVKSLLDRAVSLGASHLLVGNLGHLDLAKKSGLALHGDLRLNICNSSTASFIESLGFEDFILSPELTLPRIRDIGGASGVVVYGRVPLMVTEKCVGKEISDCRHCESGVTLLKDRRGVLFPVIRIFEHRSLIVNSMPVYMADRQSELSGARAEMTHFIFTDEDKEYAESIIEGYKKALPPSNGMSVRRIK